LIRNADECAYSTGIPSVTLVLEGNSQGQYQLRLDSNAEGFTLREVTAICTFGYSTKSSGGKRGLGFKSLFSFTRNIDIHSGQYHFRFDRARLFGVLAPTKLDRSCCESKSDGIKTRIILHLNNRDVYESLRKVLESLDSNVLLFLRKIRKLAIITDNQQVHYRIQRTPKAACDFCWITQRDILSGETESNTYLAIFNSSHDEASGWSTGYNLEDEFALAFPVRDGEAWTIEQAVYSLLPIHKYGLNVSEAALPQLLTFWPWHHED
jgi:hypothetical protein